MTIIKTAPSAATLEQFIGLGAVREERDILGNIIVMQTLPVSVISAISIQCSGLDVYARDRFMKIEILSRAIKSIAGYNLVVDDNDEKRSRSEMIENIKLTIGKWEDPLVDLVFEHYTDLTKTQRDFFEELKKKFKKMTKT